MIYQGILPNRQQAVHHALPSWMYGIIDHGRKIVDPHLHFGCFTLGYQNPEILQYVMHVMQTNRPEIAESFLDSGPLYLNHVSFEFADRLYKISGGYHPFFSLSGSDANEGAIKLAAAWQQHQKNNHKKILVGFEQSYHGSTWMTMSLGSDSLFYNPFYNFPRYQNIKRLPRNFDLDMLDWNTVACVMLETASYGTGFDPVPSEFWDKINFIQKNHGVLIIIDDIFIGGGKTGHYLGWQNLPIRPDIFTMGKAITAGFFPLAATFCTEKIYETVKNIRWEHGFTYNFNLAGIASAMKYLDILEGSNLLADHDTLVCQAKDVFTQADREVVACVGLNFIVEKQTHKKFYLIPVNATQEYFDVLAENLDYENRR